MPLSSHDTRVSLWILFSDKLTSEMCSLRILRGQQELDLKIRLRPYRPIISEDPYCAGARDYFIVAGLIFQPVSVMYMREGEKTAIRSMREVMSRSKDYDYDWCKEEKKDGSNRFIVLGDVLQHPINIGTSYYQILQTFNGKPVRGLRQLADAVDACKAEWMRFEFLGADLCVMSTAQARSATKAIMSQFGLTTDRHFAQGEKCHDWLADTVAMPVSAHITTECERGFGDVL